jgi:hypothetical protein
MSEQLFIHKPKIYQFFIIFSLFCRGCCSLSFSLKTSRRRLNRWVLLLQMGLRNVGVVDLNEVVFLVIDPDFVVWVIGFDGDVELRRNGEAR